LESKNEAPKFGFENIFGFFDEMEETGFSHSGTCPMSFVSSIFFCYCFPAFSVMKWLNAGRGKGKRNNG